MTHPDQFNLSWTAILLFPYTLTVSHLCFIYIRGYLNNVMPVFFGPSIHTTMISDSQENTQSQPEVWRLSLNYVKCGNSDIVAVKNHHNSVLNDCICNGKLKDLSKTNKVNCNEGKQVLISKKLQHGLKNWSKKRPQIIHIPIYHNI